MLARCASRAVGRAAALRSMPTPPRVAVQKKWCTTQPPKEVDIDAIAYGYMASQALFAALDLEVFDAINKAPEKQLSLEGLQDKTGINFPRLQTLLTALVSHGMLIRNSNGCYALAKPVEKFLVQDSKYYYGDYLKLQVGRQFYRRLTNLGNIMRTGEAPSYSEWFSDAEEANMYTRAQHNGSVATAKHMLKMVDLSGVKKLLDVGGGSGAFSIVMARSFPELNSVILELPKVAETGAQIVAQEPPEVASRIKYKPGTALDNWPVEPESYDCVLMSYLSGSVPESMLVPIYEQAFKVLVPGGRLIVHDFMVDDSLDGPPIAALWALQHVAVNASGLGLCPQNVSERMQKAGFQNIEPASDMIKGLTKFVIARK